MHNYFNIVRSVGLLFFGVGVGLTAITLPELIYRIEDSYGYGRSIWDDGLIAFVVLGFGFVATGLAGLLKAKWFPRGGIVVLVFALIGFTWIYFEEMIVGPGDSAFYVIIGLGFMVYTIIISFMLLLRNQYFLEALEGEDDGRGEDDRILDA